MKKALAIAVLAIERQPGQYQPFSIQKDMKALLDSLIQKTSNWSTMHVRRRRR